MERSQDVNDDAQVPSDAVRQWLIQYPTDAPVIVVPESNVYTDVVECVESVLVTADPAMPLLIVDDRSDDGRLPPLLTCLAAKRGFHCVYKPTNDGSVGTMNLAFDWTVPHGVILLTSDVMVSPEWVVRRLGISATIARMLTPSGGR